jgi:hypothetical protein
MRNGITKEIDWEYLGAVLAREGDDCQVPFFKAFVKECNSWGTRLQVEKQLAFINIGLTREERETLSMIGYEEKT